MVAVTRHAPDTRCSVIMVAHTRYILRNLYNIGLQNVFCLGLLFHLCRILCSFSYKQSILVRRSLSTYLVDSNFVFPCAILLTLSNFHLISNKILKLIINFVWLSVFGVGSITRQGRIIEMYIWMSKEN